MSMTPAFMIQGTPRFRPGASHGYAGGSIAYTLQIATAERERAFTVAVQMFDCMRSGRADLKPSATVQWLWAEIVLALLEQADILTFGAAVINPLPSTGQIDCFRIILPCSERRPTEIAVRSSIDLLNRVVAENQSSPVIKKQLTEIASALRKTSNHGVNRYFILKAAHQLGIPILPDQFELDTLGTGKFARTFNSLSTERCSYFGFELARNKLLCAQVLRSAGLPGSINALARTPDEALRHAEHLGFPVVVKPVDMERGEGVYANLESPEAVLEAFGNASQVSSNILIERWAPGTTHRFTVIQNTVVRVVRRIAGGIIGDGQRSVAELVAAAQHSERQRRFFDRVGEAALALDSEAIRLLEKQGLRVESIPEADRYVRLRNKDNANAGGHSEVLDHYDPTAVHPDNLRLAIDATAAIMMDIAGVDIIMTDARNSWLDHGATICEINSKPQLSGRSDEQLYREILRKLIGPQFRIDCHLLLVPEGYLLDENDIASLCQQRPGATISSAQGIFENGLRRTQPFRNSFQAAAAVLRNTRVNEAICVMSPRDCLEFGLPVVAWDSLRRLSSLPASESEKRQIAIISSWARRPDRGY